MDTESICGQLIKAVRVQYDPFSPRASRLEAYKFIENFKQTSTPAQGIQCSILLAQHQDRDIRHFGLKLLEDVIKLRWNDMNTEEKIFVKENAMRFMDTAIQDVLKEPTHVKDAIARNVVEMAKREYPQQWPTFLHELQQLSVKGEAQAELVMYVMLRLVEDVAVLQTLEQNQRRKEIYQALSAEMETIFQFLLSLLQGNYTSYTATHDPKYSKVCQSVLATFSAFVEWAPMSQIMANEHYLVKVLCHLLQNDSLKLPAAECLLAMVSWKGGKVSDRGQLLVLFRKDLIFQLFESVKAANLKSMQGEDDQHYLLLKRLVQILVQLGEQVCTVWSLKEPNCGKPENIDIYLDALLAFTEHASLMVNYYANELWAKFVRHADIVKDEVFKTYIPKWVEIALQKSIKIGYPSKEDHPSCAYARMDFETDEEFLSCFGRYRIIMSEVLRIVSGSSNGGEKKAEDINGQRNFDPTIPYQYCDRWLRSVLARPINNNEKTHKYSQVYLELDAIQFALEAVLGKLNPKEELTIVVAQGLDLLKLCLEYSNAKTDPMLLSVLLSCISSLFVVVTITPPALDPTLACIFKCITFKNDSSEPDDIRMLRRHGCALLVKIATRYPQTLVPRFDYLKHTIVDELFTKSKALSRMEFVTLVEGLILISNEFRNYDMQSQFIGTLAKPVCDQFKAMEQYFVSPEAFMKFTGFDGVTAASDQRAEVAFCLNFFVSVFRRACVPKDILSCRNSGFVDITVTEVMALRNPASEVGCHILDTILKLTKNFIDMFKLRSNPALTKVFDMLDIEKFNVHGHHNNNDDNKSDHGGQVEEDRVQDQESKKLQYFIMEQFDNLFQILAKSCQLFGHRFYKQPGLAVALVNCVFRELQHVPDYRMRPVNTFLKTLINKCPKSCFDAVLAPVLTTICPYMFTKLEEKWILLKKAREDPNFDENNTDSQEVIDDVLGRQITRDYLDIVKAILTSGGGSDLKPTETLSESNESLNNRSGQAGNHLLISDLGQVVMKHEGLCQDIVKTLLNALSWPDSSSSQKASILMELIIPILASNKQMSDADAYQIFFEILKALNTMGQYEINYIHLLQLSIQAYEHLRPNHQSVADLVSNIEGIKADDFKRFDDRVLQLRDPKEKANDRVLKNMFKKLVGHIVGKDIAVQGKNPVVIKNLPTLQLFKTRHKTPSLEESLGPNSELGITNLFNGNKQSNVTML